MQVYRIKVARYAVIILACLGLVLILLPVHAKETAPTIVDFYPQCNYELIETVEAKERIEGKLSSLSPRQYKIAFSKISSKLKNMAQQANAEQIVLLNKTSIKSFNQHFVVFSAELIKTCEKDPSFDKRLANLDTSGQAQIALATTVMEIENKLVIKMPMAEKRLQPALTTKQVDITGAYGVKLGASQQSVIDALGTPTVEINVSEHLNMLMYGRRHVFEFLNGNLHAIMSNNAHFSAELNNLLEFDDRFDDVDWQVNDASNNIYTKDKTLNTQQTKKLSKKNITEHNDNAWLIVQTQKTRAYGSNPASYKVDSFTLNEYPYQTNNEIKASSSVPILSFLSAQLENKDPRILIDEIHLKPTIKAWVGPAKRLYAYGQHVAIEVIGNRVSTIHILESLYAETSPFYRNENWSIGSYEQGMSAESANLIADESAFYFNEQLEIMRDKVTIKLYFYEQKNEVKLYGGEINFF